MSTTLISIALIAAQPYAGAPSDPPAAISAAESPGAQTAVEALAAGRADEALALLEAARAANPDDPAVLINIGIAHAQAGDDAKARAAFRAALASDTVIELETADGAATDSRRLARKALTMLERGAFRSEAPPAGQLSYRH